MMNWNLTPPKKSIYDKAPTSEQLKLRDENSKRKQSSETGLRSYGRKAFDNTIDAAMSFMGIPINQSKASQAGELVSAGLPFAAFTPKGVKSLYHGTQRVFNKFNPSKYDKDDTLGWMTHFAENPEYANEYAMGYSKGIKPVSSAEPLELDEYFNKDIGDYTTIKPNVIQAKPEAKNVLDLVDPNVDDLSQALAFANPFDRKEHISLFKNARRDPERYKDYLKSSHYPDKASIPNKEIPSRVTAGALRLDEDATESMPFDAIRYHDVNEKSWAIPSKTPIRSIFGAPLNTAAEGNVSPIQMFRQDELSTGNFPVLGNFKEPRTANDYLNWGKKGNDKLQSMNVGQLMEEYAKTKKPKGFDVDESGMVSIKYDENEMNNILKQYKPNKDYMKGPTEPWNNFASYPADKYYIAEDFINTFKNKEDAQGKIHNLYNLGTISTSKYNELLKTAKESKLPPY